MIVFWCLLWGFLAAVALMALYDFALSAIAHVRWRRNLRRDSVSEYNAYRNALDRARSSHPTAHHRPSRQRR